MNPLRIQQYGANKNLYTAFSKSGSFVGWIKKIGVGWAAKPANSWKDCPFTSKNKAIRYLIASITK